MYLCFVLGDFQVGILKTQVAYLDEKTGLKGVLFRLYEYIIIELCRITGAGIYKGIKKGSLF